MNVEKRIFEKGQIWEGQYCKALGWFFFLHVLYILYTTLL